MLYNVGNGDMGSVGHSGILMGMTSGSSDHDHDQEIMNPMFHDQEHQINNSGATTTAVTMTAMKQESCQGRSELGENRGSGGVLWGFPWQMGAGGGDQGMNMVHEVDSGRSQIAGWNGLGSTAWHGLLNTPLM